MSRMRLSPCRFKLPLRDNKGQPVEPRVILDLRRELNEDFKGYTVHPTSQGHWQSQAGRLYQEEVVVYEVAIPEDSVSFLRDLVCRFGLRLGQLAMYFDAPAPSVEIIDLSASSQRASNDGVAPAMNQNAAKQLLAEAKKIARRVDSWMTLTNALDDPQGGLISRYFPTSEERREFLSSPEYEELDQLLLRTIKRKGLYPRSENGRNGASG